MKNREIKIRFWDEENKSMSKSFELLQYMNLSGDARYFSGKGEAFSGDTNDNSKRWHEKRLILQYTGLKDKKGKEIYEGDIVEIDDEYFKIYFNERSAGFQLDRLGMEKASNEFICNVIDEIEVIGNIYQNSNLTNNINN